MSSTRRRTTRPGNKGFDEWGEAFGDDVMAGALIDRFVHHCHIVNICGNSYPRPATRGWGSSTRPQVGEFQVAAGGSTSRTSRRGRVSRTWPSSSTPEAGVSWQLMLRWTHNPKAR